MGADGWLSSRVLLEGLLLNIFPNLAEAPLLRPHRPFFKPDGNISFQKILQGPKESYTEFLARLQEALKRQVTNSEVSDTIFQLLAYENANTDCKKAIGLLKGKANIAEYIKACQGVGTESFKSSMLAQAMANLKVKDKFSGKKK